jgi:hypothetical protein
MTTGEEGVVGLDSVSELADDIDTSLLSAGDRFLWLLLAPS